MSAIQHNPLQAAWRRPTFLLPLFCLCVLLASTETLTLAIATAVMMMLVTLVSSAVYALVPRSTPSRNTALWLLLCGSLTALLEVTTHAWRYALFQQLGMFLPMLALCSVLLARTEMRSGTPRIHEALKFSLSRALRMSAGYLLAAIVLGAGRELTGRGSLLLDAGQLWGAWAAPLETHFFRADTGFLLAVLAPGAFIASGLCVALYNWLALRRGIKSPL